MIFNLRKGLVYLLALQLIIAPIMVTHAQTISPDTNSNSGFTHNEEPHDAQLPDSHSLEVRASSISFQADLCDQADGGNDRCTLCLCINSGVFNVNLGINDLLYQASISTETANTSYFIHSFPLLRPPITIS